MSKNKQTKMSAMLFLLFMLIPYAVTGFTCTDNKVGNCFCDFDQRADYEIHCPYIESKFSIALDVGRQASVTCNPATTYIEMVEYLQGLELGILKHLKIVNCPVPEDSFQDLIFNQMGAEGVLAFQFRNGKNYDRKLLPFHFKNLTELIQLDLSGSLLGTPINSEFFTGMDNLKFLDLSGNKGINLHSGTFLNLTSLRTVNLADCDLAELDEDLFLSQTNLTSLNLHSNLLSELKPNIFRNLNSLELLFIKANKLTSLPTGIFDPLKNLTNIDMGFNMYQSLPENLFSKNTKLKDVVFIINGEFCGSGAAECADKVKKIDLPSTLFQNPSLESIKILHVPSNTIPADIFKGATNLKNVTIQSSYLEDLPVGLFTDSSSIEKIDFSGNLIRNLTAGVFDGLRSLTTLRLLKNRVTKISDMIFKDLDFLESLELQDNLISKIDRDAFVFLKKLKYLDLSSNSLVYNAGDGNSFLSSQVFQELVSINLSKNSFSTIEENIVANCLKLEKLDLSYNSFRVLHIIDFNFVKSKKILFDLSYNQIERVPLTPDSRAELSFRNKTESFDLNISGNPIICDCFIIDLKKKFEGTLDTVYDKAFALVPSQSVNCGPKSRPDLIGKSLLAVDYVDLNCHFPSDLISSKCPNRCGCSWNRFMSRVLVNCTRQKMNKFPDFLPLFKDFKDSKLEIHLENNLISNLTEAVQHYFDQNDSNFIEIEYLYLTGNLINEFHQSLLPPNLKALHIDDNRIQSFFKPDLNYLDSLINQTKLELKLGKNPYLCSCDSQDLYHFMRDRGSFILDKSDVILACPDNITPLAESKISDFCLYLPPPEIIAIIIIVIFFLISAIILLFFYTCYRETILIWIYSKSWSRFLFTDEIIDSDKPYDAFISYSHHDTDFVNQVLLPGLESPDDFSYRYKCLTHQKDWLVGQPIPENIINSVQSSRRTLIVLSKDFIQSMWSKLEFRAAHAQALQDKTQRVVIIVRGELPAEEDMEEDLKKYIRMNTYIESENPWFWQRLRYALPHRGGFWQRRRNQRTRKETDQLELMRAQVEAELGKSSRTPSPPTIQTNPSKPNNGLVNGNGFIGINNSYPEQNGHVRVHNETNGHVHSETNGHTYSETNGHAYGDTNGHTYSETNGRVEKERRAQEYLDKIIPHKASDGGRIVRDILGSQK